MKIAVVGSGYVGLVSGACLADFGHDIVCSDIPIRRITSATGVPVSACFIA